MEDQSLARLRNNLADPVYLHDLFGEGKSLVPTIYPMVMTTLWWTNIAIENGPFIVDFPIKNGDFPLLC